MRVAELAEHLAEHEQQEQRLQDHLGEEDRELPPGDVEVAAEHGEERLPLTGYALGAVTALIAASFPVRWMNTSSSVGVPSSTRSSDEPCSASSAAAGATSSGASPDT